MAGIYLHIPFCKKRCIYCDFYSTTQENKKDAYIDALCHELELRTEYIPKGEKIETIYWGGGTPSQLEEKHFQKVFNTIYRNYDVIESPEITIEANPDDLTTEYIQMLRKAPFNRISIGIQTFNDDILNLLHRRHSAQQAIQAVKQCQEEGFQNISIDLIYGLPGETADTWNHDLDQAIQLNVTHISAYHLIFEENTPLWQLKEQHVVNEADEDKSILFFEMLIDRLTKAGYEHYEISNFALPGMRSKHNSSYWTGKNYIGCGPSAHSYNGISRQWNVSSLEQYIQEISHDTVPYEIEELDIHTRYNDLIITSIRTKDGLSLDKLKETMGMQLYTFCLKNAAPYLQQNLLVIEDGRMHLTQKGIFISDGIMSDLLWVEDE